MIEFIKKLAGKDSNKISLAELPEEILIDIIKYLPHDDKLSLTLVCQKFNRLVAEELQNVYLVFDGARKSEDDVEINRSYRSVELRNLSDAAFDQAVSLIHYPHILKNLSLKSCIISERSLNSLLKLTPFLQKLTFCMCEVTATPDLSAEDLAELPVLSRLCLGMESWMEILNVLQNVFTLKEFIFKSPDLLPKKGEEHEMDSEPEYKEGNLDEIKEDFRVVKQFLQRQNKLKCLEVRNGHFFDTPFLVNDIQLKDLNLFIPDMSYYQMVNFLNFTKTQKVVENCLFNILPSSNNSNQLMSSLFYISKLPTLKNLSLVLYEEGNMAKKIIDVENPSINTNVKSIQLKPCNVEKSKIKTLFAQTVKMFPNLNALELALEELEGFVSASDLSALNSLKQIESLNLQYAESRHLRVLSLPSLKVIELGAFVRSRQSDWNIFLAKHQKLTRVDIQLVMEHNTKIASPLCEQILSSQSHLKALHICTLNEFISPQDSKKLSELAAKHPTLPYESFKFCGMVSFNEEKEILITTNWCKIIHESKVVKNVLAVLACVGALVWLALS